MPSTHNPAIALTKPPLPASHPAPHLYAHPHPDIAQTRTMRCVRVAESAISLFQDCTPCNSLHLSLHPLAATRSSPSAPKARNILAQGEALGYGHHVRIVPKGRNTSPPLRRHRSNTHHVATHPGGTDRYEARFQRSSMHPHLEAHSKIPSAFQDCTTCTLFTSHPINQEPRTGNQELIFPNTPPARIRTTPDTLSTSLH